MGDALKWLLKTICIGAFWVFFLSITVNGRSFFSYANEALLQNRVIQYMDNELAELWRKVTNTAQVTINQMSHKEHKG